MLLLIISYKNIVCRLKNRFFNLEGNLSSIILVNFQRKKKKIISAVFFTKDISKENDHT